MKWTYRVSKQTLKNGDQVFAIREFHPNRKGELTSWSENEITPVGLTLEDLKGELELIMKAFDKEVIDIGDEKNGIGDPPEWDALINESIRTLNFLRNDTEFLKLSDTQKVMAVKGFLNNLGESDE